MGINPTSSNSPVPPPSSSSSSSDSYNQDLTNQIRQVLTELKGLIQQLFYAKKDGASQTQIQGIESKIHDDIDQLKALASQVSAPANNGKIAEEMKQLGHAIQDYTAAVKSGDTDTINAYKDAAKQKITEIKQAYLK
ncbi:MAG: hypothetical protein EBZ47_06950 [Chlamydiae bacterium]|nr:hypothetical protein [Chlamydiota bacterium]